MEDQPAPRSSRPAGVDAGASRAATGGRRAAGTDAARAAEIPAAFAPAALPRWRWRPRARFVAVFALAGAGVALSRGAPVRYSIEDLAAALGESVTGYVAPSEVRWEPAGGVVADLLWGRQVLFLASEQAGTPRDLYRARVRLTPEGRPLSVSSVRNLTATPLGDDHALVVRDARAAFATNAYGQEQSVTALDLRGEDVPANESPADRAMRLITNFQQTGTLSGIGRVDVILESPARRVSLSLPPDALAFQLVDDVGTRTGVLDFARQDLAPGAVSMHAEASRHLPKRFSHWAVDTVRAISWVGPAPIAWLEERVFAARDVANRAAFRLHGDDARVDTDAKDDGPAPPVLPSGDGSGDAAEANFPPPSMRSMWKTPEPDEGVWVPAHAPWLHHMPSVDASAPPPFYTAFVRPDEQRPYAKVLLVAMDTRQLDFEMEAGSEDPKPLTGGHGPGHIPRDPAIYSRVVAAFNGAFKTEHGNYGMMVHRRVLLPPQPSAATFVILRDGRTALGSWPANASATLTATLGAGDSSSGHSTAGADPGALPFIDDDAVVSYRQNLDPLVDLGKVNPSGRAQWGFTLPGTGMQTERSGVCVTAAGHLVYAWGDDVSAITLGKAMKHAGCVYGMHLDMNPHHTGFVFARVDDLKARKYKTELLSKDMELTPERYIEYAAKDFFYVMLRDPAPPAAFGRAWEVSPGTQPPPSWMPAVFSARADGPEGPVELTSLAAGRATFHVRAGEREPDARTGAVPSRELPSEDGRRVLLALGLGVTTDKHFRALATDGKHLFTGNAGVEGAPSGLLVAIAGQGLAIHVAGIEVGVADPGALGPHDDHVELPLLVRDGEVVPAAVTRGARLRRSALGITADGRVVIARGVFPSHAPLADALVRAGCRRAVVLDRGAQASAFIDRAGTPSPPRARYDESVLYAIAMPMRPRAFRFEPRAPLAQAVRGKP